MSIFIPVNGEKKKVKSIFANVNGETKRIKSIFGNVDGEVKKLFEEVTETPFAGRIIATHTTGRVACTTDGENWSEPSRISSTDTIRDICYGNGVYVAVGTDGTTGISFYSEDGENWERVATSFYPFFGVTYGNGIFVCYGRNTSANQTSIFTSSDGKNWTYITALYNSQTFKIRFCYDRFIIVGKNTSASLASIYYSTDSEIWNTINITGYSSTLSEITYGNGIYVAAGYNIVVYSADGINWNIGNGTYSTESLVYGNGVFLRSTSNNANFVTKSTDGKNWTAITNYQYNVLTDIIFVANKFYGVSYNAPFLLCSKDGENWIAATESITYALYNICHGDI